MTIKQIGLRTRLSYNYNYIYMQQASTLVDLPSGAISHLSKGRLRGVAWARGAWLSAERMWGEGQERNDGPEPSNTVGVARE